MSAAGRPVPVVGLLRRLRQQAVLLSRQRGMQDQASARLSSRQSRLQPQVCSLTVLEPLCSGKKLWEHGWHTLQLGCSGHQQSMSRNDKDAVSMRQHTK